MAGWWFFGRIEVSFHRFGIVELLGLQSLNGKRGSALLKSAEAEPGLGFRTTLACISNTFRSFSYIAIAGIPGKFIVPASRAEDTNSPSYFGLSGVTHFLVRPTSSDIVLETPEGVFERTPREVAARNLVNDDGMPCKGENVRGVAWCDRTTGQWMCGSTACSKEEPILGCTLVGAAGKCAANITTEPSSAFTLGIPFSLCVGVAIQMFMAIHV